MYICMISITNTNLYFQWKLPFFVCGVAEAPPGVKLQIRLHDLIFSFMYPESALTFSLYVFFDLLSRCFQSYFVETKWV